MAKSIVLVLAGVCAFAAAARGADVVLENPRLRAVIADDGTWRSLIDKAGGRECLTPGKKMPVARAKVAGKACNANSAALAEGKFTLGFAGADTRLTFAVTSEADWIALRLERVAGTRPTELTLLQVPVALAKNVGPRLAAAWDETLAVGLQATGLQAQCAGRRVGASAELVATTQDEPGPHLEGAGVVLVAAPPAEFRLILRRFAAAFGLAQNIDAAGTPSKELPLARRSYWFLSFGEKDVDQVIDYCRRAGLRQVMLMSGAWCRSPGHYTFDTKRYPDAVESLKRTVGRLHAEGILVGMHCFASKVAKIDAYVTPVPDRRFWADRLAPLAADVGAADTSIRVAGDLREWAGSPVAKQKMWEGGVEKHQEVVLDDEIVRYKSIGPEGKWDTFEGCNRGAWGTAAAAHKGGTAGRHYGVDGCINGYIIDQETTLLDEATTRLAAVFNACGFDMVYFDGGEDVDKRRFTYYVSKFQQAAMAKFTRRPLVHMGTIMTHNLWHSFTRSGTADTYLNTLHGHIIAGGSPEGWPTVRGHIDKSVQGLLAMQQDMMPAELGWFGIWPKEKDTQGLQLDEMEYLMARSLAFDAPISLETSFSQMEKHPLTPGLLEIVRAYEELRASGPWPDAALAARLREPGRDFILVTDGGRTEFVDAAPLARPAGSEDLRAMAGDRTGGAVVTLWHYTGKEGRLLVAADPQRTRAIDVFGKEIALAPAGAGRVAVPFGPHRTTILFAGLSAPAVRELMAKATAE